MAIGIIGLAQSGKTTVFNGVTRGHADVAGFRGGAQPNVGVCKVPDPRLQVLSDLAKSKRMVPAEVEYFDIPASRDGAAKAKGIGGEYLNMLQRCEALLLVCRAFDNPSVSHPEGSVDAYRDAATMGLELAFSDMAILERREQRIVGQLRSAKASERDALHREKDLIVRIREGLEAEVPVREQQLPTEAAPLLENFQLLTAKPLMIVFNVNEDDAGDADRIGGEMKERLERPGIAVAALSGRLEMELAQMTPEEEAEFRTSLGVGEPSLDRMIRLSYGLLGLMSFLTTGEDETRAWTIRRGTPAVEAAGKIHTDIQRGFIRAEVVSYDALIEAGGYVEAKKRGVVRSEGKQYVVQDGDVINFLFNV